MKKLKKNWELIKIKTIDKIYDNFGEELSFLLWEF